MADDLTILLHHQIKLWDEVGIGAILIEHVMFRASWAIDIPECLSCKVLYFTIILGLF